MRKRNEYIKKKKSKREKSNKKVCLYIKIRMQVRINEHKKGHNFQSVNSFLAQTCKKFYEIQFKSMYLADHRIGTVYFGLC